ncbi:MAG TPA: hypothetical protein VFE53_13915 [Mucilaginibacter sp.]|jgi:tetratricopeptide (TPR) repeat protein|nr:hypothetical protein [Mucilaginibacter sp.]
MGILKNLFSTRKKIPNGSQNELVEGDIFYTHFDNKFHVYKLLVFDKEFECYHVLCYEPVDKLPTEHEINRLKVAIYHAPIATSGFVRPVFLANCEITEDDLTGYHEYLKLTQESKELIASADKYYQAGLYLTDHQKHNEAIEAYSKAIALIPTFFEAIDNRAFCKMDMGRWEDAIEDFKSSLIVKPNTLLAEFSIGECYFRLAEYQKAKQQFEIAKAISPDFSGTIEYLKKVNDLLGTS